MKSACSLNWCASFSMLFSSAMLPSITILLTTILCTVYGNADATAIPISFAGINYNTRKGPDWAPDVERCKTRGEIVRDLTLLSRITNKIRLLSIKDCRQGALVRSVLEDDSFSDMQLWLGLWVGKDPNNFADEVQALEEMFLDMTTMAGNNLLTNNQLLGISVGSEAIYREDVTVQEAIANLDTVRDLLSSYDISVPAAIVDIAPIYSASPELRLASDMIATNTFPFWEGTPIAYAVDELDTDLQWLLQLPESFGKPFLLGEHGWPSGGYIEGVGEASPENQKRYMAESFCYLKRQQDINNWEYYVFTGIDNAWRQVQDPNNTVEGNWGFLDSNLNLKDHFVDFEFECGSGSEKKTYTFASVDWSVPPLPDDSNSIFDSANSSCSLWDTCQELAGDCCPTVSGGYLGCCREELFLGRNTNSGSGGGSGTESGTKPVLSVPVTATPTATPTIQLTNPPTTLSPSTSAPLPLPTINPTNNDASSTAPSVEIALSPPILTASPTINSAPSTAPSTAATLAPSVEPTLRTNSPTILPTTAAPSQAQVVPVSNAPSVAPEPSKTDGNSSGTSDKSETGEISSTPADQDSAVTISPWNENGWDNENGGNDVNRVSNNENESSESQISGTNCINPFTNYIVSKQHTTTGSLQITTAWLLFHGAQLFAVSVIIDLIGLYV